MVNDYAKTRQEAARVIDYAFKLLYDSGMSIIEIGKKFGISRERVRQRLARVGYTRRIIARPSKEERYNERYARSVDKFQSKLQWNGNCLEWTGGVYLISGYGRASVLGWRKNEYAHRLAYQLENGPIPKGAWVLHHCDNPKCCNLNHLYLGDARRNAQDRAERGRGNLNHLSREERANRNARIYNDFVSGTNLDDLSNRYNLSKLSIDRIIKKEKHARITSDQSS